MSIKVLITNHLSRITQFIFLTMTVWALTACQSSSDCFREEVVCAALVTDTQGLDDHGINQDAWAGLQDAKENGLADQVDYIESVDARDYGKNIIYFASRGYDLIFTTGIGLDDATSKIAAQYFAAQSQGNPSPVFIGFNQPFEEASPNMISLTFPEDQAGFAAGVVAAQLTKTGIVAAVCETSGIDSMWRSCEGFRAGVKFANEQVSVAVAYREDGDREKLFIDGEWGYETGAGLIERGADVLFAAGGGTGQGALRAAVDFGIFSIGSERDQAAALAESSLSVVTSFFGDARFEVQEMMRQVTSGEAGERRVGRVRYVSLNPSIPPGLVSELDLLLKMLENGEIRTNIATEKP